MLGGGAGGFKNIQTVLSADNAPLKRTLRDSGGDLRAFQKQVEDTDRGTSRLAANLGKGLAAAATAVAAGLAYAVTKAMAFDTQMRNVNSLARLNEQQFAAMEKQVISMSKELPQSAETLAAGLYDIASSGFQGADGLKVLDAAARSASAGLTTTEVSAKGITAVLNAYGLQAKDAADVSDVLFSTVNLGVITFEELAGNLGDVVGATSAAKIGIDQVGAAIATMTLSGIKGAQATTSLSALINKLVQPSDALTKLYEKLGYESGATALQQKGLRGVMEDVRKATGGNITSLMQLFPEIEAARGALALMTNEGRNYSKVSAEITDKTKRVGATQRVLDEQMKAVSNQWKLFTNQIDAAAIGLGIRFLPKVTQAMSVAQDAGAAIVKVALDIKERAASGMDDFGDAAGNVLDLLEGLGRIALAVAEPMAKIAGGAVLETFNALASILADITGLMADHQTIVLALGAAYAVHAAGGIGAMTNGLGILGDLLHGKLSPGMYDAAEGFLNLGDRAKAAGGKLKAMAVAAAPAVAVGGALALAITAWSSYSQAADRAGDITKKTEKALNSFKLDDLQAALNEARAFVSEFEERLTEFGEHTGFADFVTDIGNAGKNWGTLAMADNLEDVQEAANRASERIGMLRYHTIDLWRAMGQKVSAQDAMNFLNDLEGMRGPEKQTEAMRRMQTTIDQLGPKLRELGIDMGESWSAEDMVRVKDALAGYNGTAAKATDTQKKLVEAMGAFESSMGDAAESADNLEQALDELMGAELGVDQATIAWLDGLVELRAALKKNGDTLNMNSEAGRKNRSAIIGQVEKLQDLLVASTAAGDSAKVLSGKLSTGREALIKAGIAAGFSRSEMVKLLAQYKLTPELVETLIREHGGKDVAQRLKELKAEAEALGRKKPKPTVTLNDQASSRLKSVQDRLDRINGQTAKATINVWTNFLSRGAPPDLSKGVRVGGGWMGALPPGSYRIGGGLGSYPGHTGQDYPAPTGTPVFAMRSGVVTRSRSMTTSYGKHVYIDHGGGLQTRYAHMSRLGVSTGDPVSGGQQIGNVGSTGNSTGPHLHLEVRSGGRVLSPRHVTGFDDGGFLPSQARIQPGRGRGLVQMVRWGERETDGEAFIPLAVGKRERSTDILAQVADRFGLMLVDAYAAGGFRYPAFKPPPLKRFEFRKFTGKDPKARREYEADKRKAYAEWRADRIREVREAYAQWRDDRYRRFETYKENVELYRTRAGMGEGAFVASRDVGESIQNLFTARDTRARAAAELRARVTANPHDTAEDFYRKPVMGVREYTAALRASVTEQGKWNQAVTRIAAVVGPDVVASLRAMGEQGEEIIKKFAGASVKDMKAMAAELRKLEFGKFLAETAQDVRAQQQFAANLAALIRMGRADLAAQFAEMGYQNAGNLAAQAVISSPQQLTTLTALMNAQDQLASPLFEQAVKLAGILQKAPRPLGVIGLSNTSGTPVGDVMGLLQRYASVFGGIPAAKMLTIRRDLALIGAGKQPSGLEAGAIVTGSGTSNSLYYRWAEPGSGGESLIPHDPSRRRRALQLWEQTGRILAARPAGGGGMVVVAAGAVQVDLDINGSNMTPAQIEAMARRVTNDAMDGLARHLAAGRRG